MESESAPDPLYGSGWSQALRNAIARPSSVDALADVMGVRAEFEAEVATLSERLFDLGRIGPSETADDERRASVTGLVTYAQCPKRFYWSDIDPLPRRRNPAAIAGTELHRRIELFNRGQVPFDEVEPTLYDVPEEAHGTSGFTAFRDSRFATETPALVEAPFELGLANGYQIRGRVDAIYAHGEHWEVVDFKSGEPKTEDARMVQLEAYAIAVTEVDFGRLSPATVDVTFAYLGGGLTTETYHADEPWLGAARSHLDDITSSISAGVFDERPGQWCSNCDFLRFCAPGQAWVRE